MLVTTRYNCIIFFKTSIEQGQGDIFPLTFTLTTTESKCSDCFDQLKEREVKIVNLHLLWSPSVNHLTHPCYLGWWCCRVGTYWHAFYPYCWPSWSAWSRKAYFDPWSSIINSVARQSYVFPGDNFNRWRKNTRSTGDDLLGKIELNSFNDKRTAWSNSLPNKGNKKIWDIQQYALNNRSSAVQ